MLTVCVDCAGMNLLLSALLCFLLCSMLPVDSMMVRQPVPLNMAEDAVDDMYDGCTDAMAETVKNKYFEEENTGIFGRVWENAEFCAIKKLKHPKPQALTKSHLQAICAYTSNYKRFHATFNDHIRNDRSKYGTSFQFHSFHFWLTSALQIINRKKCHTTYRRTDGTFTGWVNQLMRFGSFTSSSYKTTLTNFGRNTCFQITTCSGAYLKYYSYFGDSEQEVLVPPYEVFRIVEVKPGYLVWGLADCRSVYTLTSVGVKSSLNCKAVKY
uniref:NAD(P)(+)--arginine ADP-ribosyltransferase n=1 Tax=Anabas testudineus TaxID=64144 RepID=A0A3Q1HDE3_ANATE